MDLLSYISDRNKVGGCVIDIKKAYLNVDALIQECSSLKALALFSLGILICVF